MDYLERALDHASKGYFVFPAQENKRPVYGFSDWEGNASTDHDLIKRWWATYPNSLPAIAPGRSGHAVVDVDKHDGKEDGEVSLSKEGISFDPSVFSGTSVSGNGKHFWFRSSVGSVNGVLPGVDRKAQGGYVIAPYELPLAESISSSLPARLGESPASARHTRRNMSDTDLNEWLSTVGAGPISAAMWFIVEQFSPHGNQQMSISIARAVRMAATGESGAQKALDKMLETWLSVEHSSGDPESEFRANVRSAIQKFGEPVDQEAEDDELISLLNPDTITINTSELVNSLKYYCDNLDTEWFLQEQNVVAFRMCAEYLQGVESKNDVSVRRTKAKEAMLKTIGESRNGK